MTRAELVSEIAQKTGLRKEDVNMVLEAFMKITKEQVSQGESVHLRGFGSFHPKFRKAKIGQIIAKRKPITIPSHYVPAFSPSSTFKKTVRDSKILQEKAKQEAK